MTRPTGLNRSRFISRSVLETDALTQRPGAALANDESSYCSQAAGGWLNVVAAAEVYVWIYTGRMLSQVRKALLGICKVPRQSICLLLAGVKLVRGYIRWSEFCGDDICVLVTESHQHIIHPSIVKSCRVVWGCFFFWGLAVEIIGWYPSGWDQIFPSNKVGWLQGPACFWMGSGARLGWWSLSCWWNSIGTVF